MPTRNADLRRSMAVPAELAGKWVAWNAEQTRVVAAAETLQQIRQAVRDMKIFDPVLEKVPPADVRFVGKR